MQIEAIHEFLAQYLESVAIKPGLNQHTFMGRAYGRNNAFMGWPAEPIATIITNIRKQYPRISEKTLRNLFQSAAVELFEEAFVDEDADPETVAEIESLLPELAPDVVALKAEVLLEKLNTQIKEFDVFVPLQGIKLTIPQYEIAKGILYPKNSDALINRLEQTNSPESIKEDVRNSYGRCSAYFVCTQEGDNQMAKEFAREQAKAAIQLLRFYLTPNRFKDRRFFHQIRLVGEPEIDDSFAFLFQPILNDGEKAGGYWSSEVGSVRTYELTLELIELMNENGMESIQRAVLHTGSSGGKIQPRLQRAIRWFSYAVSTHEIDQKFVGFAVALESLLTDQVKADPKQSWGGITQTLAERCAFLLSEKVEERIRIAKDVRELYGMRSNAVHSGHSVSTVNVERIQALAKCVILAFVSKDFENWDNFTEWIRRCKYGGVEDPSEGSDF